MSSWVVAILKNQAFPLVFNSRVTNTLVELNSLVAIGDPGFIKFQSELEYC